MSIRKMAWGLLLWVLGLPLVGQAQTYTKNETIEYHNDLSLWVLGQVKRTTTNGTETSRTEYAWMANPTKMYSFGKLQQTLTYNSDGTIATVTDGNNNATILSNWYRGIPGTIRYPATPESPSGATQSAGVSPQGWVTSVTDENGFQTAYTYDAMGRLTGIVYPSGDDIQWQRTTFSFEYRNVEEHGLPAGHWLHSKITGGGYKNTFLDPLWRPVLVHEFDAADIPGTLRSTRTSYDGSGRVEFQSYPSSQLVPPVQGIWTKYDALGRVKSVSQDSEHGLLMMRTEYSSDASGALTQVIDPKGNQTRTWYQMFDEPSYAAPVRIEHPEGAITQIPRDVFGKPIEIWRR